MNEIYVFNQNLELQGVIDEYVSIIWRPAYYDIGDFEIYLDASDKAIDLLRENMYVVRSSDISVVDGVTTYKNVMIIKNLQLTTDAENGDFYCVTGRELKFLLRQRIVWGQRNIRDTVEYAIRRLIGSNAVDPVEPTRVIPNMQFAEPKGFTEKIDFQISNVQLDEGVIELCKTYNYGWDIYIRNNKLTVDIYKGVDRSYNQTTNPYVVFSEDFENLYTTEYVYESENYANMTLIGGEGEGGDRIYSYVNNDVSGLERYEVFTDARDISQNLDSEEAISYEDYLLLLDERGRENLAGMTISEGFTGEVLSDVSFKYGTDFNLGDIVTVINKYGITKNVRVLSAIESEGEDGVKLLPQFSV
jgi:hypothetical protein